MAPLHSKGTGKTTPSSQLQTPKCQIRLPNKRIAINTYQSQSAPTSASTITQWVASKSRPWKSRKPRNTRPSHGSDTSQNHRSISAEDSDKYYKINNVRDRRSHANWRGLDSLVLQSPGQWLLLWNRPWFLLGSLESIRTGQRPSRWLLWDNREDYQQRDSWCQ